MLAKQAGAVAVGSYLGSIITPTLAQQAAVLDMGLWSFWERLANDPMGGALRAWLTRPRRPAMRTTLANRSAR